MTPNFNNINLPPNKSHRINDFFFPQPSLGQMSNFSNYYPLSNHQYLPPSFPSFDPLDRQMEKFLELELMKRQLERSSFKPRDKYKPVRDLLKTVDEIQDIRSRTTPLKYEPSLNNDGKFRSPLKSEYLYKNILNSRPESYQNYKKKDKIGNYDVEDFFLPSQKRF